VVFLVTSRVPINVQGEAQLRLDGLDTEAAMALFSHLSRDEQLARTTSDVDRPVLAELMRRLDGLPLAIEFAAHRCRMLTVSQLLLQLDHRVDFLRDYRGIRSDRHRSLFDTLEYSWRLLAPEEQRALQGLTVFAGSFSIQAAQVALSDNDPWPLDRLQALVDKSLVDVVEYQGEIRLRLKACVRGFLRSLPTP